MESPPGIRRGTCHRTCHRTFHRVLHRRSEGFTLVEAAITLAIVALVLVTVLQGMEGAKLSAHHTRQRKTAYELGVGLLGEVTVGLWREELESGMTGNFAELDEPNFYWELALGEDVLAENDQDDTDRPFDNFAARRDWEEDNRSDDDDEFEDGEEPVEPFEKIRLRVTFPKLRDFSNELVLERWVPWEEVYGPTEEDEEALGGTGEPAAEGANDPGSGAADAGR